MADDNSLQIVEQKTVTFYDDDLVAVHAEDGQIYVSVRNLCNALGLKRAQRQTDRIKRDEVLVDGLRRVPIMGTLQRRPAYVLRADLIPLWLAGIEASRVSEDVRGKLVQYKKEVAKVLWEAFRDGRLSADTSFNELLKDESNPSVQAFKMAQAIMRMAQQQLILESRVDDHEQRLERLESAAGDTRHQITPSQASQISQAVKAIGMELGKQTGRNEFGSVYGELYRRFEITSYKMLPKNKFDEAMSFLSGWYGNITGSDDIPF